MDGSMVELGFDKDNETNRDLAKNDLILDLVSYIKLHFQIFGGQMPMPLKEPRDFFDNHSSCTFADFLKKHDLEALMGMLEYGYEVQGYGPLGLIPAYYGLIWMTPPVVLAILADAILDVIEAGIAMLKMILRIKTGLDLKEIPVVTAWSKGWGDVWDQLVEKEDLAIIFSANTLAVKRYAQNTSLGTCG
ncbi:MAG: hypothetical protein F6K31_43000 [Symploca sp. SIO2G7]|nr:hypothetical protein [Symploca sp. SIO2G7]